MDEEKLKKLHAIASQCDAKMRNKNFAEFMASHPEPEGTFTRYAGMATLLRAPHTPSPDGVDIALVGVPFDLGVTNRPGARHGPAQLRELAYVSGSFDNMHHVSKIIPAQICKIVDVGDVPFSTNYALDEGIASIETFFHKIIDAGAVPVSAGGDHSITFPILKAVGRDEPVGVVHFDAHCDTMGPLPGGKFHHGGPFRNAALAGALDPERTIQIGIRGPAEPFWDFSYESGMRVIHIEEFHEMGVDAVIQEARRVVGDGPTYISFDVDGLDSTFAPGTGTPEIGGLLPREAQQIIRGLQGLNLVGGDLVEVAPPFDPSGNTALVGGTILYEILCVVADAVAQRKSSA